MLSEKPMLRIAFSCAIVLVVRAFAAGQTTVSVNPPTSTVSPGDTVTVNVIVANVSGLHAAHTEFTFNNSIVQCIQVVRGPFLQSEGATSFFAFNPSLSPSVNTVTVDEAILGTGGVSGSGTLVSIKFIGIGPGTSPVTLSDVDLRDGNNSSISSTVQSGSIQVPGGSIVTIQVPVSEAWNMISLPVTVDDPRKSIVFPTAVSQAFSFDPALGYVAHDTLTTGVGYWIKFASQQNVSITGMSRSRDTVQVNAPWNMIGVLSFPVDADSVIQNPSGIIVSDYFGFEGGYFVAGTLYPGKGYWVRVWVNGQLILR